MRTLEFRQIDHDPFSGEDARYAMADEQPPPKPGGGEESLLREGRQLADPIRPQPLVPGRGAGGPLERMDAELGAAIKGKYSPANLERFAPPPTGRNMTDKQLSTSLQIGQPSYNFSGETERSVLQRRLEFLDKHPAGQSLGTAFGGVPVNLSVKDVAKAKQMISARLNELRFDEEIAPEIGRRGMESARESARAAPEPGMVKAYAKGRDLPAVRPTYEGGKYQVPDFGPGAEGEFKALKHWLDRTKGDPDVMHKDPALSHVYRIIGRRIKALEKLIGAD
jgi:hypothetical protein